MEPTEQATGATPPTEAADQLSGPIVLPSQRGITRIVVERLFGLHSYDLSLIPDPDTATDGLLILYGPNGSGKTTILNTLTHILSPEHNQGHRTAISRTPFRRIDVEIGRRHAVSVYREGERLVGTFALEVFHDSRSVARHVFEANSSLAIPKTSIEPPASESNVYQRLKDIGITFHYLADDRRSDGGSYEDTDAPELSAHETFTRAFRAQLSMKARPEKAKSALAATANWIRQQALKATASGSQKSDDVFVHVVSQIALIGPQQEAQNASLESLKRELVDIDARNRHFTKYGLVPSFDATNLIASIERAGHHTFETIRSILRPHLDGIHARHRALQELRDLVDTFVNSLNDFYSHKTISFNIRSGFHIVSANGEALSADKLSSGEKQLLIILSDILCARGTVAVFIIDEPEISLNVAWQRKLATALLSSITGTASQLILATHSIEILAQFANNVVSLTSTP